MIAYGFEECVKYCGFDNLPEGLEKYYASYMETNEQYLIDRSFMKEVFARFAVPSDLQKFMSEAIETIENDDILFHFTKFLVWDMCSARNRCDADHYQNLNPSCLLEYQEIYSFLLLLACVIPSMKMLQERKVPFECYRNIPYQPMKNQFHKLINDNDGKVSDFPWDMNFYTCSIFLFDRFLFIPYKFEDSFRMYRNCRNKKVVALHDAKEEFRRDGQVNGINGIFDEKGKFSSIWEEDNKKITANKINPMGFVEKTPISLVKKDWDIALDKGDTLLALHIPSGTGYNPERLKNSMELALDFYKKYFPELTLKGFWSESWLYDSKLSMVLNWETSNIVKVQRQFYLYPINEGDGMLRYEVFGDWKADPARVELKTSLQKAAAAYMKKGGHFNTMSMIVLEEEVDQVTRMPYITQEDIDKFMIVVDSHFK